MDALHDSRVEQRVLEPDQWTRTHTLAEAFSTLTGGRLGFQYLPDDAAALIREISAGIHFVDLSPEETLAALEAAQARGVRGGRVHDWLHARAAQKARVAELLTDNLADFDSLENGFAVLPP